MKNDIREQPSISLEMLHKLIRELPAEAIKSLPVEKLPDNIPADIADEAPFYSRNAVETLIMEANAYQLSMRMRLQRDLGEEIITAIDQSHQAGQTANVRVFRSKVMELIAARQKAARGEGKLNIRQLSSQIKRLSDLLIDVRMEQGKDRRMLVLLEENTPSEARLLPPVLEAKNRLKQAINELDRLLGHFFTVRLQLARQEMRLKRKHVESMLEKRETLRLQLQELNRDLQNLSAQGLLARTFHRKQHSEQKERIKGQITRLVTDIKTTEVVISETELTAWLDAVVDASLHPQTRQFLRELLTQSRTALYSLLNHYCMSQEDAARQIAANPFIQVNPKDAIQFMLKSEEFILKYFARKREQASAWLSQIAQDRIDELGSLERELVQELRRTSRH